jgi:hypothetical protein
MKYRQHGLKYVGKNDENKKKVYPPTRQVVRNMPIRAAMFKKINKLFCGTKNPSYIDGICKLDFVTQKCLCDVANIITR